MLDVRKKGLFSTKNTIKNATDSQIKTKNNIHRLFASLNFIREANNLCTSCHQCANFLICESVAIPFI